MSSAPNFRAVAAPLDASDHDLANLNRKLGVPALVREAAPGKPLSVVRVFGTVERLN